MTKKPRTAERPKKRDKEISIEGYDLLAKDGSKDKVLDEVFKRLADISVVSSEIHLASSLRMIKERYLSAELGSVGGGLFFIELGRVDALIDYCVLLAKPPRALDWKTIDGEKVRLIWAFGFHREMGKSGLPVFTQAVYGKRQARIINHLEIQSACGPLSSGSTLRCGRNVDRE